MSAPEIEGLAGKPRFLVAIEPGSHDPEALTIPQCRDIVLASQVRLGGWNFPYALPDSISSAGTYVHQQTAVHATSTHIEEWRMYRSGQFVFRALLPESVNESFQASSREETEQYVLGARKPATPIQGFVSFMRLIYRVTDAYVFAARLAQAVPYRTDVKVQFTLQDVLRLGARIRNIRRSIWTSCTRRRNRPFGTRRVSA